MIAFDEAVRKVRAEADRAREAFGKEVQFRDLDNAVGEICAEKVVGREAVPRFHNSSMDGFAVRSLESSPGCVLQVRGRILAGDEPLLTPARESRVCYEIMTGAPMPVGFDAVHKVEEVRVERDSTGSAQSIQALHAIEPFENFRRAGADFAAGAEILDTGDQILPEQVMALASVGISRVKVRRRPRVSVLATGSELCEPQEGVLPAGKIRNSTSAYIRAVLPLWGAEVRYEGIVSDTYSGFKKALVSILSGHPDVILTTGAVSRGSHDFIPDVMKELGAEVLFHQIAIRPGKPQFFARMPDQGPAFFGLPGNPVSTAIGLRFFVLPYLRGLRNQPVESPIPAMLAEAVSKPRDVRCLFKAHLSFHPEGARVLSLAGQPSFIVSSLLRANAWVVLEEGFDRIDAGSRVSTYPLHPFPYDYHRSAPSLARQQKEACC